MAIGGCRGFDVSAAGEENSTRPLAAGYVCEVAVADAMQAEQDLAQAGLAVRRIGTVRDDDACLLGAESMSVAELANAWRGSGSVS
jgi:hypothetical protein